MPRLRTPLSLRRQHQIFRPEDERGGKLSWASTVTYLDGTVTNAGDQTVTHAMVHVTLQGLD